jgi:Icc-related predicted phosphoesterase
LIRIAAVGDLHVGDDGIETWRRALARVSQDADLLLIAGDLTRIGTIGEARALLVALAPVAIPTFAVLGNHDYHHDHQDEIRHLLEQRGIAVLEGSCAAVEVAGVRVGIAGSKGFGGGFENACGGEFGEPEMKAFIAHTRGLAERLSRALESLEADLRLVLLHYAPVPGTLAGERCEIYPFLGSHLLGEAIDAVGADLVLHGHAHGGTEAATTPGGVPVRNVAQPVIRSAYRIYCLAGGRGVDCQEAFPAAGLAP